VPDVIVGVPTELVVPSYTLASVTAVTVMGRALIVSVMVVAPTLL